jgi:hypothetical protein
MPDREEGKEKKRTKERVKGVGTSADQLLNMYAINNPCNADRLCHSLMMSAVTIVVDAVCISLVSIQSHPYASRSCLIWMGAYFISLVFVPTVSISAHSAR